MLQKFECPEPLDAVTGIRGVIAAEGILKRNQLVGMLIGGLVREAWWGSRSNCSAHKDVDVMVIGGKNGINLEKFEGGIDWWMPDESFSCYENGNNVQLIYSVRNMSGFEPGLYLPHHEAVLEWRKRESSVFGKQKRVVIGRMFRRANRRPCLDYPVLPAAVLL
ncbi:MAG: hypothetical protein WCJ29_06315 [bacterium]